jgi:hypothetical protein
MQTVEAESAFVLRTGNWTVQPTGNASGGSYLYSSAPGDALQLIFSGSHLAVIFVQHPALGSFSIELDGAVVQTVSETGDQAFGQRITLNNLSNGPHTVRIYAAQGTVTVDAFAVEPQALTIPVIPTEAPTVAATATPTQSAADIPTATVEATVLPTETSETQPAATLTETPVETATEVPTAIQTLTPLVAPLIETMDDGAALWRASGSWVLESSGNGGADWLATASTGSSTLTLMAPVQTANLTQPILTFVSRQAITGAMAQVEISLDRQNWQSLAAVGPSIDWITVSVDLSAYRAQTVWLRFVWLSSGEGTWQLDNIEISEPLPTATSIPATEVPTQTPTDISTLVPTVEHPITIPTLDQPTATPTDLLSETVMP